MRKPVVMAFLLASFFSLFAFPTVAISDQSGENKLISIKIDTFLNRNATSIDLRYSPLLEIKNFSLPGTVASVREGMSYVLAGSGYSLNSINLNLPENIQIVSASVPNIQRTMTDISVVEALKVLIGNHHNVAIDPITREVGFMLNGEAQSLNQTN